MEVKMGIKVNITKVSTEGNCISFNHEGESKVVDVVFPAKISFAKLGEAEIGMNNEDKVNYVKMVSGSTYTKKFNAYNEVEISEGVSLIEFREIYNEMSKKMKINATNLFTRQVEGKTVFDVIYFRTRFEKIIEDSVI